MDHYFSPEINGERHAPVKNSPRAINYVGDIDCVACNIRYF